MYILGCRITPGRRYSKTPILSRNVDQQSIETVFSIAICRPTSDHWQSKTLFISICDPRSSIFDNVFSCRITPGRRQSKTLTLSRNVYQKLTETVFSIAICRPTGDKWQSKTLFISICDPRSSIFDYVFDCRLTGVRMRKNKNVTVHQEKT